MIRFPHRPHSFSQFHKADCLGLNTGGDRSLLYMVIEKRAKGRPKTRLSDHLKDTCGLSLVEMAKIAQNRDNGWRFVKRATAARNQANCT